MKIEIGSRVVTPSGDVGIVEEFDDYMIRVRLMNPDNIPSCMSSWCHPNEVSDGTNIVPIQRSKVWKAEAQAFYLQVCDALNDAKIGSGP